MFPFVEDKNHDTFVILITTIK